jgi:redox-sensitive bicupin YhaK (pirin superfamily)
MSRTCRSSSHAADSCAVFAGSLAGATSLAPHFSEIAGADLEIHASSELELPLDSAFEHAVLVLEGDCVLEGQPLDGACLYYLGTRDRVPASRVARAAACC